MNDPVVDTLMDKMEMAETRIDVQLKAMQEISGTVGNMKDQTQSIIRVADVVDKIEKQMTAVNFPVEEMTNLTLALRSVKQLMINPPKQQVTYRHTFDHLLVVVISFALVVMIMIFFLFEQKRQTDQVIANDITWRKLKLDTSQELLLNLQMIEQEYLAAPKKMKNEVETEELKRQQQEENRKLAAEKQREMIEYQRKAGDVPDPKKAGKTK